MKTDSAHCAVGNALFDLSADPVVLVGDDGRVVRVNSAFEERFGAVSSRVVGAGVPDVFSTQSGAAARLSRIRASLRRRGSWDGRLDLMMEEGRGAGCFRAMIRAIEGHGYLAVLRGATRLEDGTAFDGPRPTFLSVDEIIHRFTGRGGGEERFAAVCLSFSSTSVLCERKVADVVLAEMIDRLRGELRPADLVARDGRQLVVVLDRVENSAVAAAVAARLLEKVSAPCFVPRVGEVALPARCGFAVWPEDGRSCGDILSNAAVAAGSAPLSEAKRFERGLKCRVRSRLSIEARFRRALANDGLSLHFQPRVSAHPSEPSKDRRIPGSRTLGPGTRKIVGMEALARWTDEVLGPVSPETFVPLAEEAGLIVGLGEWVLTAVTRQITAWRAAGVQVPVSLNIAGAHFLEPGFAARVEGVIALAGLAPADIEIEITETTAAAQSDAVRPILSRLRSLGVRVAVDDFGTGYSNLAALAKARLFIDVLKLDRSLAVALEAEEGMAQMVAGILRSAREMGVRTVAEGVETAGQERVLAGMGVDEFQGFLFARPMPAEEILEVLRGQ